MIHQYILYFKVLSVSLGVYNVNEMLLDHDT